MKTLINKNNPQIRITMPDEDVFPRQGTTDTMTILFEKSKRMARQEIDIAMNEWTLVEEDSQLPANLDEAAKDAQEDLYGGFYSGHIEAYQEAFKRGARWMAEQIKGGSK